MLNQPTNIKPDEVNGSGTVDITENLEVSWQITGGSAMTAYQIVIYSNSTNSTQLYSTGKVTLSTPFWGISASGAMQRYSVTISASDLATAGLTNGNEYKIIITQWWSANDSIEQSTASLFITRAMPTVAISNIVSPLSQNYYTFEGTYTQAQGDAIKWLRWEIADEDNTGTINEDFYDSGYIYGTGDLQCEYEGFFTGSAYNVKLTIETINGQQATTGWQRFWVEYNVSATSSTATASLTNNGYVLITWEAVESATGYTLFRKAEDESILKKIASVGASVGVIRDYTALSNKTYTYYIFARGALSYLTEPITTDAITIIRKYWIIIEAEDSDEEQKIAVKQFLFRYGVGGISEGGFSNNNNPSLQQNFTRYPTRQHSSYNYLSGSVAGLIGILSSAKTYVDTAAQTEELTELSVYNGQVFLLDPKGRFLQVHTNSPIQFTVNNKSAYREQTATVSWAEVGSTDGVSIIATPEDSLWAYDLVVVTQIYTDPETGTMWWVTPDEGEDGFQAEYSSTMSLSNGALIQDTTDDFNAATMVLNTTTDGAVIASF